MANRTEWLRGEIAAWERESLIDEALARRLRERYPREGGSRRAAMMGLSVLGALLLGGGIILLLAHNWADMSRGMRTMIALTPLIVAQLLAVFGAGTGRTNAGWREGLGVFWTLAIGAAIAMVGQIYNLAGSYDTFMLTWLALALPVVYLLRSSLAAVLFVWGVVGWAAPLSDEPLRSLGYWPLTLAVTPLLAGGSRRGVFTSGLALLRWVFTGSLLVGVAITLQHAMPGLWIVIYAALLSAFYFIDLYFVRHAPSLWHRPMRVVGVLGCVVLSLMLTYHWPWEDIGWRYWHHGYSLWRQLVDIAFAILVMGAVVVFGVFTRRQWRASDFLPAGFMLVALVSYVLSSYGGRPEMAMLLFNAFILAFGVVLVSTGARALSLVRVNAGMLLLSVIIGLRFFDADLSLVVRGVVFVVLGAVFLVVNRILSRKFRGVS